MTTIPAEKPHEKQPGESKRRVRILQWLIPAFAVLIFSAALYVISNELRDFRYREVVDYLRALPPLKVLLAIVLAILAYTMLTGYDFMAMQYIENRLDYRRIGFASFVGFALNNNVGLSGLAGSSYRYRLYSAWGLSAPEIARVITFSLVTMWLGFLFLAGSAFVLRPVDIPPELRMPFATTQPLGILLLIPALGYLVLVFTRRRPVTIRSFQFLLPSGKLGLAQLVISALEWLLVGLVLFVLLPEGHGIPVVMFIGAYLVAQCAGLLSNLPGGLGVFEAVMIVLLSDSLPAAALLGSILAYRGIYYLMPLFVAAVMLAARETIHHKEGMTRLARGATEGSSVMVPQLLAVVTLLSGAALLVAVATPAMPSRMQWLAGMLPLAVIEAAHLLAAVCGAILLLLGRSIQRRLASSWTLTVSLLIAGIVLLMFKGLDYEEAVVLAIGLAIILPCRRHFYRRSGVIDEPFNTGWITSVLLVLVATTAIGLFVYRNVEFTPELWTRFDYFANSPRSFRAGIVVGAIVLLFALVKITRRTPPALPAPTADELNAALSIARNWRSTHAWLALAGDKALMFSSSRSAFLMYGIAGRSWVSMGDPVGGTEPERIELAWKFIEQCDRYGASPVFYEVRGDHLPLYIDIGLSVSRIGERARLPLGRKVPLPESVVSNHRQLTAEGAHFEILTGDALTAIFPLLRPLADEWVSRRPGGERGFSRGRYNEAYLRLTPVAVLWRGEEPIAFANVLVSGEKEEVTIDLIRLRIGEGEATVDYLLAEIIGWSRDAGYEWLNLGVAPLQESDRHETAPIWQIIGLLPYEHDELFGDTAKLRAWKQKFSPVWEPVYLASPRNLSLPVILSDVATLIAPGSVRPSRQRRREGRRKR
jgi:phosphatidylglycerol lysyltransferase